MFRFWVDTENSGSKRAWDEAASIACLFTQPGGVVQGLLRKGSCTWPEQLSLSRYPKPPLQTPSQFSQLKNDQLTEASWVFLGAGDSTSTTIHVQ